MSTSIGNLAVYLSADTGQAERKLAGFSTNVDKFDKKMRAVGSQEPRMKGFDRAGERYKRIAQAEERHRGGVAGGGRKASAGHVIRDKAIDLAGLGEIGQAASAGGPWAAAAVAGIAAVTLAAAGMKKALDLAGEAEANRVAFETLTGSAEKGRALTAALDDYAAKTAFSSRETAELGKQLLGVGVEADQVMPAIKTFGDIAGTLGGDTTERMKRLTKAFGDVKANGRLAAEELNQFSEAGVNLGDALAKTMNKPREEIKRLASEGEIGFGEVATALNSLVATGGQFAGGADKMSKTWKGMLGQVEDGTDRVFRQIGEMALDDLGLKEVFAEGLRVLEQYPDVLGAMRPGLKFFGDHVKLSAKLLGDAHVAGLKLGRVLGPVAKAFFGPELKQFEAFLAKYKLTLADLEKLDLQGAVIDGAKKAIDFVEPYALAAADLIDAVGTAYARIDRTLKLLGDTGKSTFTLLHDGFKLLLDPLDNGIARMKLLGDLLANPLKAADIPKALAGILDDLKKARPEFKFGLPENNPLAAVGDEHATRKRVEDAIRAGREGVAGVEAERNLEKFREAMGPVIDSLRAVREINPAIDQYLRTLEQATGMVGKFGHGLDAGAEKLSAHLRDEAKKLSDEYRDPLATLFKKADELDKMQKFGAITDSTRALAFGAEAERLLKVKGEPNRPAPAIEYGSREFAQLTQQATGGGPRDLLSAVRALADEQKEAVRIASQQLDELRKLPRPAVVKMGGE